MKPVRKTKKSSLDNIIVRTCFRLSPYVIKSLEAMRNGSTPYRTYKDIFDALCSNPIDELIKNPPDWEKHERPKQSILRTFAISRGAHQKLSLYSKRFNVKRDAVVERVVLNKTIERAARKDLRFEVLVACRKSWENFFEEKNTIIREKLNYEFDYDIIDIDGLINQLLDTFFDHWQICIDQGLMMDVSMALPNAIEGYAIDVEGMRI